MRLRTNTGGPVPRSRAGITLTEILIAIMILGIGIVSLATLFPLGLWRLREAQRQTRSALLFESAACDVASRSLFNRDSFVYVDLVNNGWGFPYWYVGPGPVRYDPLVHDTPYYGALPVGDAVGDGASSSSYGLPFAYDPLWRQITLNPGTNTTGVYLDPLNQATAEFRFGDGSGLMRNDPDGYAPSAHGLQRLTNFNRPGYQGNAAFVPQIFVSPEDVVWQDATKNDYNVAFVNPRVDVGTPSPVVPDLSLTFDGTGNPTYQPSNDFRFSWMLTARQANGSAGAAFEGNVVVFENRIFGTEPAVGNNVPQRASGEYVCEGVFGASRTVQPATVAGSVVAAGYGMGADRTVLIRWSTSQADPVVKVGDWIADVTYERNQAIVLARFYFGLTPPAGATRLVSNEWDNLPAQRCYWYQVQKVSAPQDDNSIAGFAARSMTVYVNRKLEARTLLDTTTGNPIYQNAVLICPQVVNVIPQTFFLR